MSLATPPSQLIRFGTFEVDVRARELRKQGMRVKLQEQPFSVLEVLLARRGETVTREELRSAIWSADTFVDFDNSLNASINKLRDALGDSADSPRFIETIPRRGYRFIAPVVVIDGDHKTIGHRSRHGWRAAASAVVAAAILVAGGFYWHSRQASPLQASPLTEKDTIVLADFTNTTGDSVFDDTLKQGLRVQLDQSPFLNILSDEKVGQQLPLMGRAKDERLTGELARDLCQRLGHKAVLTGSIASLGTHFVIGLNVSDCRTGDGLVSQQIEADSREQVLHALSESARNIRQKLGESLPSIQKYDAPLEQATTPSLDALRAYSEGLKERHTKGAPAAIPFFKRAVELDPRFAMAYARLSVSYDMAGEVDLMIENMRRAYELRGMVSERERLYLEAHYYHNAVGDFEKAAQTYELWKRAYPRDFVPYDNLQNVYAYQGRHEAALAESLEALRLQADNVASYEDVVLSFLCLNRLNEAQAVLQQAEDRKLRSELMDWLRYWFFFLKNDVSEMERLVSAAVKTQGGPYLEGEEGMRLARLGRLREARTLWRRTMKTTQDHGPAEFATFYEDTAALTEAYFGNSRQSRADVSAGQHLTVNRLSEPVAAFALASAGDIKGAEKLSQELNRKWPLDSVVQRYWLPAIHAAIALDQGRANQAVELLRVMGTYEMSIEGNLGPVFAPTYLRGRAFLTLGNGNGAAAEFQKIIGNPGLSAYRPVGALAKLGMARAYVLQADTARARNEYEDFLSLWKDADPDIPILKEAKAEYVELQ